jgi:hypothetical protein
MRTIKKIGERRTRFPKKLTNTSDPEIYFWRFKTSFVVGDPAPRLAWGGGCKALLS